MRLYFDFGLTFLENEAQSLVVVVVLLLAFDIAVHDDMAMIASKNTWLEAYWADREIWFDIFTDSNFVGNQVLIIACIRLSS